MLLITIKLNRRHNIWWCGGTGVHNGELIVWWADKCGEKVVILGQMWKWCVGVRCHREHVYCKEKMRFMAVWGMYLLRKSGMYERIYLVLGYIKVISVSHFFLIILLLIILFCVNNFSIVTDGKQIICKRLFTNLKLILLYWAYIFFRGLNDIIYLLTLCKLKQNTNLIINSNSLQKLKKNVIPVIRRVLILLERACRGKFSSLEGKYAPSI